MRQRLCKSPYSSTRPARGSLLRFVVGYPYLTRRVKRSEVKTAKLTNFQFPNSVVSLSPLEGNPLCLAPFLFSALLSLASDIWSLARCTMGETAPHTHKHMWKLQFFSSAETIVYGPSVVFLRLLSAFWKRKEKNAEKRYWRRRKGGALAL